jgi:hypothetical protein
MKHKLTFGNSILIKLDKENESIKLRNGFELYVDTTFDPEKHMTVTGVVWGLPGYLKYTGQPNKGMPWDTPMELRFGDKVICYYLAVVNCFKPERRRYVIEGDDRYVLIEYQNIFCKYDEGLVIPINGYVLVEPTDNPVVEAEKERMRKLGMERVVLKTQSNTEVNYGKVKYIGTPNRSYVDPEYTDEGVDVVPGDTVVLKKINDIPLQYDLHAKIDGGTKYWRVQRRNILGKL